MSVSLRPLTDEDAEAVADLFGDYELFHNGISDRATADDVLDWWRRTDGGTTAVVDEHGRLIAAGSLRRRGDYYIADNFVHPDARGQGAGALLLDWSERRTAEAGLLSVHAATTASDPAGKELLEARGYRYIRSFYRMIVELESPPPAPFWPEGFAVALDEPAQDVLVYEALEEAFTDHWGHEPRTFEEWIAQAGPLDERMCYLVRTAEGTVAAAQVCDEDRFGTAWIAILGVRAAWRRHGLGGALLRQAFSDLYTRGRRRIALGVDAENTTGATRLYERVGMTIDAQDDAYEKSVSPVAREAATKLAG